MKMVQNLPMPFRNNDFDTPEVQLSYSEGPKNGPVLLLLHGVTRRGDDFQVLADDLSKRFHVFILDFRGHGLSEWAESYYVSDYARDVKAFVQSRIDGTVIILGHSLGAMVAATVAAECSQVEGIVLEDPPYRIMGRDIQSAPYHQLFVEMQKLAVGFRDSLWDVDHIQQRLVEFEMAKFDGTGSVKLGKIRDHKSLSFSAHCLSEMDPKVLTPVIAGEWLKGYDFQASWRDISCPILLLRGNPKFGSAVSDDDAKAILSSMANSCERVFPDVGHFIHQSRSKHVVNLTVEFAQNLKV
jgi:pimeloyl-ACP methyl ester carboxylesterase